MRPRQRQGVEEPDAAMGNGPGTVRDFKVEVARSEHRLVAPLQNGFVEATLDPALAAIKLAVYLGFHLKTLGVVVKDEPHNSSNTAETPRVFSFIKISALRQPGSFAYQGLKTHIPHPLSEL